MRLLTHIAAAVAINAAVALVLCWNLSPAVLCLILALGCLFGLAGRAANPSQRGALHTAAILALAVSLLHPFLHPSFVGSGDARDYFRMFADFIAQHRAGVHEVFVGQTAFAFEGTVHTTRTSPMLYHTGALLDLLSCRTLEPLVLEKFTLFTFFCAAGFAFYLCGVRALHLKPRTALLIASVYLSAPAVLAPLYFSDMYATFTAMPFVPIFLIGVVRLYDDLNSPPTWLLLGVGSGGLFWTHPAVGIWVHLSALLCLVLRLPDWRTLRLRTLLYALPIGLVLAYPIIASFQLGSSSVRDPRSIATAMRHGYLDIHDSAFRWSDLFWISPLGDGSRSFKNWSRSWVMGVPVVAAWVVVLLKGRRIRCVRPLVASTVFMVLLMNGSALSLSGALWRLVPNVMVRITYYWPLQRFDPIATGSALVCLGCVMAKLEASGGRALEQIALASGLVMLGANLAQAWTLQAIPTAETLSYPLTTRTVDSDNIVVPYSNYDFMNGGLHFDYIPSGRSDPLSEIRLHAQSDYRRTIDTFTLRRPDPIVLTRALTYGQFNFPVCSAITLPPSGVFTLTFDGLPPGLPGTLQIRSDGVPWSYSLPYFAYGGDKAFGTGPLCRKSLLVRNSGAAAKTLEIYYWPPPESQNQTIPLGAVTVRRVIAENHYFSLVNLTPLEIQLDAPYATVVETPRIFLDGYVARVDGVKVPLSKSPQGLVAIPVPAGAHKLRVTFEPVALLRYPFRLALAAWTFFVGFGAVLLGKSIRLSGDSACGGAQSPLRTSASQTSSASPIIGLGSAGPNRS